MSYDAFATTFSNSRKNLKWPELEYIIDNIQKNRYTSILDVGCGNGRFFTEINNSKLIIQNYLGIDSSRGMIDEARTLHPDNRFEVCSMSDMLYLEPWVLSFDAILFLASFHHLASTEERIQVLRDTKKLLTKKGRIYMTNWNLRDQERYDESHRGDGDYDIKIGQYSRYYHAFSIHELEELFIQAGFTLVENRIFEWGRNFVSILEIKKES